MAVKYFENVNVYKLSLVRDSHVAFPVAAAGQQMRSSVDVARLFRQYLEGADREHFVVLLVDRKNKMIGLNTVSIGSLTASVVHPREVFKAAIMGNAAAIICGHNHPSGDPAPSHEDAALTTRLVAGGKLLGIDVLDHVIIGDGTEQYFSFADTGTLHPQE